MNILLTGGMGYIGSHTAIVLSQAGHNVTIYDNLSNSSIEVLNHLNKIVGRHLSFVQGDIRDTLQLKVALQKFECKAVIHFAGLKSVGESVSNPLDYYENNVSGTISLLRAMNSVEVDTLVFSSSATVYGVPVYLPIDEKHPVLSATNPYGETKLVIERILEDVISADPKKRIACLRYFNPVGAHESGTVGENPNGIPSNLFPYIARVANGELPYLNIYGDDYQTIDGTGVRDYIHVMDLAEGHLAALNYLLNGANRYLTCNLGTGIGYSVQQVVRAFEKVCGFPIPTRFVSRRNGDVPVCYANPNFAREVINWYAKRDLDEMVSSAWHYEKININRPLHDKI